MSTSICPHCGQSHRQSARFCPMTGKPMPPVAAPEPQEEATAVTGRLPVDYTLNKRYVILQKIGQGGMAAVYQAADTRQPGTLWAIKEMSDAAITNTNDREYAIHAFQREAKLLRMLNHPNLPKVVDAFTEGGKGKHYLVMEFVPGQTLQHLSADRARPFSELEVLPWAIQLCDVLAYLHNQNPKIIFRDLKPSNIMITPHGQVKLIDFGIVRFFKPGKTKDTMALGTPGYSAPEAVAGQTDERSDIYSLCVTLHQLLTLHDPARTMFNLPPVRSLNPRVSPRLENLLMRGLQNQREFRWQDARQMLTELSWLAGGGSSNQMPTPGVEVFTSSPGKVTAPSSGSRVARTMVNGGAPATGQQPAVQAPPEATIKASRPTMRLVMAAAQLSGRQLVFLTAVTLILIVTLTWLLAPMLDDMPFDWNKVPIVAIFGAWGYAAYPKRGVAFVSHALLSTVLVATIWATIGSQGYQWTDLLLAALLSGVFMEVWVAFLPKVKGDRGGDTWLREVGWIAGMALIGTFLFFGLATQWVTGFDPLQWFLSAVFGAVGWFLGDLVQQFLLYKQTGLKRKL